jgi:hypothetical protein
MNNILSYLEAASQYNRFGQSDQIRHATGLQFHGEFLNYMNTYTSPLVNKKYMNTKKIYTSINI